ncbi:MAG: adenine phosphoribosyltransferase [Candidatus Omnitrophica bacterium]|nr:adenine phosphoribosyltransferase [Candidatus Omnitrophota bacterium]
MTLDQAIRKIPDFPKPGILFYDITSLFTNPEAFKLVMNKMDEALKDKKIDGVIVVESRGFIVGAPYALKHSIPMVLARKKGKLPGETIKAEYALEYGTDTLEIHKADLTPGKNWLVIDDLIATGGTLEAVCKMVEKQGATVAGIFSIIGLPFLNYSAKLAKYDTITLINYDSE